MCVNGEEINNTVVAVYTINSSAATATAVTMTTALGISRLGSSINPAAVHRDFLVVHGRSTQSRRRRVARLQLCNRVFELCHHSSLSWAFFYFAKIISYGVENQKKTPPNKFIDNF